MKKRLAILLLAGTILGAGCGNDNEFVITSNNNPQIAAPVCAADAYTTSANTALTVPAATGVLANDTPNGATLAFQATSANGGTITGAANGSFTYTPPVNFFGTDTFTYTLANFGGAVTCTVTITVNAVNGFFVDAATGSDATGSFTNGLPYATVQAAVADAGTNQDIVVRPGSYTGTVTLKNGQRLLGSGSVLAQGVVRPTLSGPIDMADGNTIDFIRVSGTAGDAVNGDGQNGGTVTNCEIANTTGAGSAGVSAVGSSGNWTISNNSFSNTSFFGTDIRPMGSAIVVVRVENNTMTNCQGAMGFVSDGTSQINASVKQNVMSNSQGVGSAVELIAGGTSTFCLDLEDNTNDGSYTISELNVGPAVLNIEQLSVLGTAKPSGAGNTGTINIATGPLVGSPTDFANGACGF